MEKLTIQQREHQGKRSPWHRESLGSADLVVCWKAQFLWVGGKAFTRWTWCLYCYLIWCLCNHSIRAKYVSPPSSPQPLQQKQWPQGWKDCRAIGVWSSDRRFSNQQTCLFGHETSLPSQRRLPSRTYRMFIWKRKPSSVICWIIYNNIPCFRFVQNNLDFMAATGVPSQPSGIREPTHSAARSTCDPHQRGRDSLEQLKSAWALLGTSMAQ